MKARVKATGEIVEVEFTERKTHTDEDVYITQEGCLIEESRLDFNIDDTPDYWTRLEHTYAGMAMQSYVSNNVYLREIREMCKEPQEMRDLIADLSILLATTLVQKLKEKEE